MDLAPMLPVSEEPLTSMVESVELAPPLLPAERAEAFLLMRVPEVPMAVPALVLMAI
jgi:hypothetical protein